MNISDYVLLGLINQFGKNDIERLKYALLPRVVIIIQNKK